MSVVIRANVRKHPHGETMCAMATRTRTTVQHTERVTLRFDDSSSDLTWGSKEKLKAMLDEAPLTNLRTVTVTGVQSDRDGRHPTNNVLRARSNAVAAWLLDAGVTCGVTIDAIPPYPLLARWPGQFRVAFTWVA